jgi:hypothetical protein
MRWIVVGGCCGQSESEEDGSWMRSIEGSDFRLEVNLTGC